MEFAGRTALVTGGASGIGLAIGTALAAEGVSVVLADIDAAQLEIARAGFGSPVRTLHLDVTDRAAWAAARQELGPIDILCNNAGIAADGRTVADTTPEAFDRMLRITLTSVFNGINAFVPAMIARRSGHVVNTASLAGIVHPPTIGAYSAAKAGVVALSDTLRAELAPHGVGVTVLCPGRVRTRIDITTRAAGSERPDTPLGPSETANAIDPSVVGALVIDGIRHDYPYVITHSLLTKAFSDRVAQISAAFDRAPAQ